VWVLPATARTPSPQALYKALLRSRIPRSQLPKGFHGPQISRADPDATDRRHHVVGEVEIDFDRDKGSILYLVFPTRADARGDLNDGLAAVKGVRSKRRVLSLPQPALLLSGAQGGVGFAEVVFVKGNVLVATIITRPRSPGGGRADALALAKLALRHLKVEQHTPS
jgi:hypothetical protein